MATKKTTKKTKANGKANGKAADNAACAAPTNGSSPFSMTDEDVNDYLASVAKGEVELDGMEADVAEKFRAVTHQSQQTAQAVQQLAAQLEQARAQQQQLAGELKGYATLLVSSEDSRRKKPARGARPKTRKQASGEEASDEEATDAG